MKVTGESARYTVFGEVRGRDSRGFHHVIEILQEVTARDDEEAVALAIRGIDLYTWEWVEGPDFYREEIGEDERMREWGAPRLEGV